MDEYAHSFTKRLKSYYNIKRRWHIKIYVPIYPHENVKLYDLAKAGFFYEGDGDVVRCCVCKIRIMNWEVGDNPTQVHKASMSTCNFVREWL